ncbi:PREDICTED: uncharacterized protein LOC107172418, partial [Diuraphis noxia]|uniref:uncharacterized protein LOC107172418 n=1 Tax=Diuraphis noxia TaxID=143948 RepID=UPI000763B6E5
GLEEVQMYRATLFNLNSEPEEDGENQKKEGDCVFLQQCTNDVMNTSEETITKIKAEPIYEAEENPWSEIKTEPSERYSDSMEISTNINLTNLEENDSENRRMVLQENAEGVDVAYDRNAPRPLYLKLKRKYTRAYGSEAGLNLIIFERCDKPEEMYGIPDTELPPNVGVVEISLDPFVDDIEESIVLGMEHSSYINRLIHFVRLEPEETPSSIDRLTVPIDNNYEGLQSLNEGVIDLINEDDNEL